MSSNGTGDQPQGDCIADAVAPGSADIMLQLIQRLESRLDLLGDHILTNEEHEYLRLAIKRQAQSIQLRQAVIEKTLAGLIWASVAGIGKLLFDAAVKIAKAHGWLS